MAVDLDDRHLLAAVHKWARANGWYPAMRGWQDNLLESTASVAVGAFPGSEDGYYPGEVHVWRKDSVGYWPLRPDVFPARSVREAVDLLCALRILPAHLSSLVVPR